MRQRSVIAVGVLLVVTYIGVAVPRNGAAEPYPPPTVEVKPIVDELIYRWDLKTVRYNDGHQSFVPQHYDWVTLFPSGEIRWSDGCKSSAGHYRIEETKISVHSVSTPLVSCNFESEDVHYEQVTHYKLDGRTLFLHTPSQTYILERFPYSQMSMHPWLLHAIVDRWKGTTLKIDRGSPSLAVHEDRVFEFRDIDSIEFTGSLQVKGTHIIKMSYDSASQERIRQKPFNRHHTTYAEKVLWDTITDYRIIHSKVIGSAEEPRIILELDTGGEIYQFLPDWRLQIRRKLK